MPVHSHTNHHRIQIGVPPVENVARRCEGLVSIHLETMRLAAIENGHWSNLADEPGRCSKGCSPWVPELNYCAHHLPAEYVSIVAARVELWAALSLDLWHEILAETGLPT